jgi:hypothetical protein
LQLLEDGWILYFVVAGEEEHLGHNFRGLWVVVGER